jgi:AraC-like DNA-binding protein
MQNRAGEEIYAESIRTPWCAAYRGALHRPTAGRRQRLPQFRLAGAITVRPFPKGQYRTLCALWCPTAPTCGTVGGRSMTIHPWTGLVEDPAGHPGRSSLDLVRRAEMLALAGFDKPLLIPDLCRALAVSQRTLRKAFNKAYGRPPCRHLRMLRLSQVRRALLSAHDHVVTVTEIATGFGFAELGRFSVEYRKVFGESPSATLHRASGSKSAKKPAARRSEPHASLLSDEIIR